MNLILKDKEGRVVDVIRDCRKEVGKKMINFFGSNKSKIGVRPGVFEEEWVLSEASKTVILVEKKSDENRALYREKITFNLEEIVLAPSYKDVPVGCRDDVNRMVREEIESLCSPSKQLQLLTEKMNGEVNLEEWEEFKLARAKIVAAGRAFKDAYFPEEEETK